MDQDLLGPDLLNPQPDRKPDRDFHDQKLYKNFQFNAINFFLNLNDKIASIKICQESFPENMTSITMIGVGYFLGYKE